MRNRLRSLALTVDEGAPGEFYWRLLESTGDAVVYEEVARSTNIFLAYDVALAAGYGALQRVVGPDLEYGPRNTTEDENADPVGTGTNFGSLHPPSDGMKPGVSGHPLGG